MGMLTNSMQQLDAQNTCLRDEHTALQLTSNTLEEKLRKLQVGVSCCCTINTLTDAFWLYSQNDNTRIFEDLMAYKKKDADEMNKENENFRK